MRRIPIVVLSAIVTVAWMWNPGHAPRFDASESGYQTFREEVYGEAPKGVCYRVLVPWLCRAAQEWTPDDIKGPLMLLAASPPLQEMNLEPDLMAAYAMAGAVAFCGYLALGLSCGWLALLLAWACIGPHGGVGDPVTLGAFGIAVWALINKRWWFWLAFAIASLNRETAPLMLVFYVAATWMEIARPARFGYLKEAWFNFKYLAPIETALKALLLWLAVRFCLSIIYSDNSMQMCWPELERNLKLIQPVSMTTLLAYGGGAWLVLRGIERMPRWFAASWWIGVALLFAMAVLWSRPERFRTYLELLPMAAVAMRAGIRPGGDRGAGGAR